MASKGGPDRARQARNQRYRDAQRAAGRYPHKARGEKAGKRHAPSQFEASHFVAVDGEGFNHGREVTRIVGANQRVYTTREHHYALLSASDGAELYNPDGRLSTKQCLDFLLGIKQRDKHAILVCFGGSYDMCHMLAFGLARTHINKLLHGWEHDPTEYRPMSRKYCDVSLSHAGVTHDYRIELRNRKSLSIWRWEHNAPKYEEHQKKDGTLIWRMAPCDRAVLWDVWGFFQGTFVKALAEWLPLDPDTKLIAAMKEKRSIFRRDEIDTVRAYNAKELRCLVDMMERVRVAIRDMGLQITRWDGAGSIAGAMMRLHAVKEHMAPSPPDVFEAARVAYSGGHIEAFQIGHHVGEVHHYDVNSAYPAEFTGLPSLRHGRWHYSGAVFDDVPSGFTLVHLEFCFAPERPFYPLFFRQANGSIIYPERGSGWYWFPEYQAAALFAERFGASRFKVVAWWHFEATGNEAPFGWIGAAYDMRQAIIAESVRSKIPNGAEKTYKLGYNSCYGKAAQQVGARMVDGELTPPTYFQLEWAGYVTSGCRAKLMTAAMQKPHAIIAIATDGLFSTERLDLYTPEKKELGAWEYTTHTGITMVMPGVYWLHDGEKTKHYSRGFNKADMQEADFVHQAWAQHQSEIEVNSERMVTLGTALMSDNFWELRGCFTKTVRELKLNGDNSKRCPIPKSAKPHRGLVATQPQVLLEDYTPSLSFKDRHKHVDLPMSEPYPITWLKYEDEPEDPETAEASDADRSFYFDREAMQLA